MLKIDTKDWWRLFFHIDISLRTTLSDTCTGKNIGFPSCELLARPKSSIYNPKRDDEHPRHFQMGVPPFLATFFWLQVYERVRDSRAEVYERVGKSAIKVFKTAFN